jgi:hypothetical protein
MCSNSSEPVEIGVKTACDLGAEKMLLVPFKETTLRGCGLLSETRRQTEQFTVACVNVFRNQHLASLVKCDQSSIEYRVERGDQRKSIMRI